MDTPAEPLSPVLSAGLPLRTARKTLAEAVCLVDGDLPGRFQSAGGARLAFSPDAMLSLDRAGLAYETLDDLYPVETFRRDLGELFLALQQMFSDLDSEYATALDFPRPYTGNIFWFMSYVANLHYVCVASRLLMRAHKRIRLVTTVPRARIRNGVPTSVQLASDSLRLCDQINGVAVKLALFNTSLSPEWVSASMGWSSRLDILRFQWRRLAEFPSRARRYARRMLGRSTRRSIGLDARTVAVIQDGYEVELLKPYMPGYRFVNPIDALLRKARGTLPVPPDPRPMQDMVGTFAREHFPEFAGQVQALFGSYHHEAVGRIKAFSSDFMRFLDDARPAAGVYSVGAHSVHEHVCAELFRVRNVPIFFFQHGGNAPFLRDPYYRQHFEANPVIPAFHIHQSRVHDAQLRGQLKGCALGSIELYKLYSSYHVPAAQPQGRKVLYTPSALNIEKYKDLLFNLPDRMLYENHRDIVRLAAELNLDLDIKVHSGGQVRVPPLTGEFDCRYFGRLARTHGHPGVRILSGGPAERIISRYGLIIMDYVGTQLLAVALVVPCPVILYLRDLSTVTDYTVLDLDRRFHIARTPRDLGALLARYAQGTLEPKPSSEMIDRYAFPLDGGDPGERIAEYIRSETAAT